MAYSRRVKHNPTKALLSASDLSLNQVGLDVMPRQDEIARKAYFIHLNQARLQQRNVPVEWWETDAQVIECRRDVGIGVCG